MSFWTFALGKTLSGWMWPEDGAPAPHANGTKVLLVIPKCNVPVIDNEDGSYSAVSDMMIDGDGTGPSHGDPDYQAQTTYVPWLNADVDPYMVLPPEPIMAVNPQVIGCKALVEVLHPDGSVIAHQSCVVGDVGPKIKLGEAAIKTAADLGVPSSPTTGGDSTPRFRYTWWPGIPANVNGKQYHLQSFV